MNCQKFKEIVESYISDELLVETNHEVLRHLENCPACRRELSLRRDFRGKLRAAVRNAPDAQIDPAFTQRLQADLHQTAMRRPKRQNFFGNFNLLIRKQFLATAALGVLIVAGFGAFWLDYRNDARRDVSIAENQSNNSLPMNASGANLKNGVSPIAGAVQIAWREIAGFAAGDHKNCALKFNLAEKPISLPEAAKKYGRFNEDLDRTIIEPLREAFPANGGDEVKLLQAHSCVFGGRRFAHVVLRRRDRTISVLVTDAGNLPDETNMGIFNQTSDELQVAAFRAKSQAVFVVSNLPDAENADVARVIMNPLRDHLERFDA